jgi:hypothetical protein
MLDDSNYSNKNSRQDGGNFYLFTEADECSLFQL